MAQTGLASNQWRQPWFGFGHNWRCAGRESIRGFRGGWFRFLTFRFWILTSGLLILDSGFLILLWRFRIPICRVRIPWQRWRWPDGGGRYFRQRMVSVVDCLHHALGLADSIFSARYRA